MKKSILRKIIREEIIRTLNEENVMDKKIKNPETGKMIKVSTALEYDKKHPAYKAAQALVGKKKTGNKQEKPTDKKVNIFNKPGEKKKEAKKIYFDGWDSKHPIYKQDKNIIEKFNTKEQNKKWVTKKNPEDTFVNYETYFKQNVLPELEKLGLKNISLKKKYIGFMDMRESFDATLTYSLNGNEIKKSFRMEGYDDNIGNARIKPYEKFESYSFDDVSSKG